MNADFNTIRNNFYPGSFWQKSYLAYDKNGKWAVVQLNLIQIILRKLFGCYKNTHSATLAPQLGSFVREWNRYKLRHGEHAELSQRIQSVWRKAHPEKPYPGLNRFFGNAPVGSAQVIGLGQYYTDPLNDQITGKVLSDMYREGDVILVEGFDSDMHIDSRTQLQTKYMKGESDVRGWEPVGYMKAHKKVFAKSLNLDSTFQTLNSKIDRLLCNVDFADADRLTIRTMNGDTKPVELSSQERAQLWMGMFERTINDLREFLKVIDCQSPKEGTESFVEKLDLNYKKLKEVPGDSGLAAFEGSIRPLLVEVSGKFEKLKYTGLWKQESDKFFKESWPIRMHSLCTEIDRYVKEGKRVLICAGSAHFFPNKGTTASLVLDSLAHYKFTVGLADSKENDDYYSFDKLSQRNFNAV